VLLNVYIPTTDNPTVEACTEGKTGLESFQNVADGEIDHSDPSVRLSGLSLDDAIKNTLEALNEICPDRRLLEEVIEGSEDLFAPSSVSSSSILVCALVFAVALFLRRFVTGRRLRRRVVDDAGAGALEV